MAEDHRFPCTGVEVWRNKKNKFVVFQLHYTANPVKCDPSYRDSVKSSMPVRQYNQEYELIWDSYAGKPVYADYNRQVHGSKTHIHPVIGLPLLRGWDFGLTPACVVAQYVEGQLRILKEYTASNQGAEQFSSQVLASLRLEYPAWSDQKVNFRDYIDPAGNQRAQSDMSTCAAVLIKKGLNPYPGPVTWEKRRSGVEYFLTRQSKAGPRFTIDLAECPVLVRGFEGGYRYNEKAFEIEPNKARPLKDEHSHPHDALQYICSAIIDWKPNRPSNIPRPSYSFSKSAKERIEAA